MKIILFLSLIAISFVVLVGFGQDLQVKDKKNEIIISGEVLRIGDLPPKDRDGWLFRLVKYKVKNVCSGKYEKDEIIVSHFPEAELDELKIGSKVCFVAGKTVGPNINDDWSIDLKGKNIHYTLIGDVIKNCECHK